jgi:hypothetical protein
MKLAQVRSCSWLLAVLLLIGIAGAQDSAQPTSLPNAPSSSEAPRPIPILSGYLAFVPTWEGGDPTLVSIIAPVVVIPIGDHFVIESRVELEGDFVRRPPDNSFGGQVGQDVQYAQLDWIVNQNVTASAGRYLVPFGMFNERLYPNWIRVFQTDPLIFPIGTGSGDGAMLRGGIAAAADLNVNYALYFSAASNADKFEAERVFGGRFGMFFPNQRLEIGVSLQRLLQGDEEMRFGLHGEWQPRALPLDIRAEFAHARDEGDGYWLEGAYRLEQVRFWRPVMRKTQLAARVQQFWIGKTGGGELPGTDATRAEFALNYFIRDGLKAFASAGRTWTPAGDSNIWTVGFAYRFLVPLGHTSAAAPAATPDELLEGEQRFRTNCGRCHMPPHKFGPRVMSTAVHHMRVRAMLTDEDMRLILKFLTQ